MRKMIMLLSAAVIMTAVPSLADEGMGKMDKEGMSVDKNECLLVAMNCRGQIDTLQQRIDKLQHEIAKGRDVYTADELTILNRKLDDAFRTMEVLLDNGGA